jgi:hypothetical protein
MSFETLRSCADVDTIAAAFRDTVKGYSDIIRQAVNGSSTDNSGHIVSQEESVDYLFAVPIGQSSLEKAARDLLTLVRRPFDQVLELKSECSVSEPRLRDTLINWMESAMGVSQEWCWELWENEQLLKDRSLGDGSLMKGTSKLHSGL